MRIAAVDFGLKRIGLAISDGQGKIALPLKQVDAGNNIRDSVESVLQALRPYHKEIERIVVGLPLLMSGEKGDMAKRVELFAEELQRVSGINVLCMDERLTSRQAERFLKEERGMSRKKRTHSVDTTSALLLLQAYLSQNS